MLFMKKAKVLINSIRIRIRILLAPILFLEKSKSLNFLYSNSNSNFTGTDIICRKTEKFKFSEFEFEFCWHSCYFRKKGKVQIFLLRIKIRILLAPMLFLEKRKSSNFLTSNSNSNFASTHVIFGKK